MEQEDYAIETVEKQKSIMTQEQRISQAVVDMCHKFKNELMKCVNCPNIKECISSKEKLKPLYKEAEEFAHKYFEEEMMLDASKENELRAIEKKQLVYNNYVKNKAYYVLQNERCMYERKEIMTILQRFVDSDYDVADPRAYIIISELVSNILANGRLNKIFSEQGLLFAKEGIGGVTYYANPLMKNKTEFSKFILDAVNSLDRILKSDKKVAIDKNFTDYLMQEMKIREAKGIKVEDTFDIPVEAEYTSAFEHGTREKTVYTDDSTFRTEDDDDETLKSY